MSTSNNKSGKVRVTNASGHLLDVQGKKLLSGESDVFEDSPRIHRLASNGLVSVSNELPLDENLPASDGITAEDIKKEEAKAATAAAKK